MSNPNPSPPPFEHRFKPGHITNPGGVPKGVRLSTALSQLMQMGPEELEKKRRRKDLTMVYIIALKWLDKMRTLPEKGGDRLLDMGLDRTEGKVTQVHKLEGFGRDNLSDPELDELWKRRQSRMTYEPK